MRGKHPGRPRWFMVTAGTSVLAASLAGCSGGDDTGGLPEITDVTSPAATPTGPTLAPEQQAVADAVTRYDKVVKEMSDGAPLEERKLRTVAVEPALTIVGKKLFELRALQNRTVGKSTNRIGSVKISGKTAKVEDCTDSQGTNVVSGGSNPTKVAEGTPPTSGFTSLVQVGGRWLVKQIEVGGECQV
jgi:hypothetical protein